MFVNMSNVMMDCYPISEWEVPFNWELLAGKSFKTITSFTYFAENSLISAATGTIHANTNTNVFFEKENDFYLDS